VSEAPRSPWFKVAVSWLCVGAPLAWGVMATVKKALLLFR
jgi:hypothetical protein